jgi:hypothetical protein
MLSKNGLPQEERTCFAPSGTRSERLVLHFENPFSEVRRKCQRSPRAELPLVDAIGSPLRTGAGLLPGRVGTRAATVNHHRLKAMASYDGSSR